VSKKQKDMQDEFVRCCRAGDAKRARELLADVRIDPGAFGNVAFCAAAFTGRAEIVRMLLADVRVDPSAHHNYAVRFAALGEHTEVLRMLLADQRVSGHCAIGYARGADVVRLLATDHRAGIEHHHDFYALHHPALVNLYDAAIARGLTMAWVARGIRFRDVSQPLAAANTSIDARNVSGLPAWESLVEPVAKRLKAGFI
jgi:hypothetical protein